MYRTEQGKKLSLQSQAMLLLSSTDVLAHSAVYLQGHTCSGLCVINVIETVSLNLEIQSLLGCRLALLAMI